jgi:hypothetical protein
VKPVDLPEPRPVLWPLRSSKPAHHFWSQLSKKTFWRYVLKNLEANNTAAMPIYCRLA